MKKLTLLSLIFISSVAIAQVPKKVIVEHFTNTKCSICASKNPGFYTNLAAHPGVLHLSVYPSSPYAACLLSQQTQPESDARTNYYGIYGGTPRFIIQGTVLPSNTNYADASIFTPYTGQTSP